MKEAFDHVLDTSGLLCPEPVMLLHKNIRDIAIGSTIKLIATDSSTTRDIPKFCHFLGHTLLQQGEIDQTYYYYIRKA
jgi:tRNA 2-thiouridine synthesizing protein A